jgi:hypothetical protein
MKRLACVLLLAGCASAPPAPTPSVLVLPGSSKSFDAFRADDGECRQHAASQAGNVSDEKLLQHRYDFAYQQCMFARGHKVPVAGRYEEPNRVARRPPPPPPR